MDRVTPDHPSVPYLTTEQMIEVDRAMIEDYRIELMQMMENAGRHLAATARERFLDGDPRRRRVVVLAGTGGNGGGALVGARRLHNWGAAVQVVVIARDEAFAPVPAHQLDIVRRMSIPVTVGVPVEDKRALDLIVDGIIGYSLKGAPGGNAGELIRWANSQATSILSLDAPSGVDTTTGMVHDPAIRATATMTLALPKAGLRASNVGNHVGELYLADIGVPPVLYETMGLGTSLESIFARSDIVRLA